MADDDGELKDTVQRLHRFIVDALRSKRDDPFGTPVTVSEIYQQLAPYRTVRTVLGFEMNADYEHALTRLLAGVDGLTRLEPPKARERLAKELESPNPDVGMSREFAACEVVLNPSSAGGDWVREQLEEPDPEPVRRTSQATADWGALTDLDPGAPARPPETSRDIDEADDTVHDEPVAAAVPVEDRAPAAAPRRKAAETPSPEKTRSAAKCSFCDSVLPGTRKLRFCPFCGGDQSVRPCAGCGEALEPEWAFCIACGTPVASEG